MRAGSPAWYRPRISRAVASSPARTDGGSRTAIWSPKPAVTAPGGPVPKGQPAAQPQGLSQLPQAGRLLRLAAEPPRHVEVDSVAGDSGSAETVGPSGIVT